MWHMNRHEHMIPHEPNTFLKTSCLSPEADPDLETVLIKPYAHRPFSAFVKHFHEKNWHCSQSGKSFFFWWRGPHSKFISVCLLETAAGSCGKVIRHGTVRILKCILKNFLFFNALPHLYPFKPFLLSFCTLHPDKNNINQLKNKMEKLKEKQKLNERKKYGQERDHWEILRRFKGGEKSWTNWNTGIVHTDNKIHSWQ